MKLPQIGGCPGNLTPSAKEGKCSHMPERIPLSNQGSKVGFGTIAAALAALSMAVLGHFFF